MSRTCSFFHSPCLILTNMKNMDSTSKGQSSGSSIPPQVNVKRQNIAAVLVNYGLFLVIAAYMQYLEVPKLIQILIKNHENNHMMSEMQAKPVMQVVAPKSTVLGSFNDEEFMRNYVCNPNYGYRTRVLRHDPLMMKLENFLAPGKC